MRRVIIYGPLLAEGEHYVTLPRGAAILSAFWHPVKDGFESGLYIAVLCNKKQSKVARRLYVTVPGAAIEERFATGRFVGMAWNHYTSTPNIVLDCGEAG